eukprot:6492301-Amphidinium_carterae.6
MSHSTSNRAASSLGVSVRTPRRCELVMTGPRHTLRSFAMVAPSGNPDGVHASNKASSVVTLASLRIAWISSSQAVTGCRPSCLRKAGSTWRRTTVAPSEKVYRSPTNGDEVGRCRERDRALWLASAIICLKLNSHFVEHRPVPGWLRREKYRLADHIASVSLPHLGGLHLRANQAHSRLHSRKSVARRGRELARGQSQPLEKGSLRLGSPGPSLRLSLVLILRLGLGPWLLPSTAGHLLPAVVVADWWQLLAPLGMALWHSHPQSRRLLAHLLEQFTAM